MKSFTRCAKHKSSSKAGGNTTTPSDHTVHWATAHLRQRPSSRWTNGQSCTNFQHGPLKWGCSVTFGRRLPQYGGQFCTLFHSKSALSDSALMDNRSLDDACLPFAIKRPLEQLRVTVAVPLIGKAVVAPMNTPAKDDIRKHSV